MPSQATTPSFPGDVFVILIRRLLRQDVESQLVGYAVEVFVQGVLEEGVIDGSGLKQGHAGAEFQMVRVGEDLFSTSPTYIQHKLRTFSESLTQDRVLQVGLGLIKRSDSELLRHCAVAKTGDLRKDKPDPMAGLSSGS